MFCTLALAVDGGGRDPSTHSGRIDEARQVVAKLLRAQPDVTISQNRATRVDMHDALWRKFSEPCDWLDFPGHSRNLNIVIRRA